MSNIRVFNYMNNMSYWHLSHDRRGHSPELLYRFREKILVPFMKQCPDDYLMLLPVRHHFEIFEKDIKPIEKYIVYYSPKWIKNRHEVHENDNPNLKCYIFKFPKDFKPEEIVYE